MYHSIRAPILRRFGGPRGRGRAAARPAYDGLATAAPLKRDSGTGLGRAQSRGHCDQLVVFIELDVVLPFLDFIATVAGGLLGEYVWPPERR